MFALCRRVKNSKTIAPNDSYIRLDAHSSNVRWVLAIGAASVFRLALSGWNLRAGRLRARFEEACGRRSCRRQRPALNMDLGNSADIRPESTSREPHLVVRLGLVRVYIYMDGHRLRTTWSQLHSTDPVSATKHGSRQLIRFKHRWRLFHIRQSWRVDWVCQE